MEETAVKRMQLLADLDRPTLTDELFLEYQPQIDLRTGQPSGPPAKRPVRTYPTRIQDGVVYVDTPAHGAEPAEDAVHRPADEQPADDEAREGVA